MDGAPNCTPLICQTQFLIYSPTVNKINLAIFVMYHENIYKYGHMVFCNIAHIIAIFALCVVLTPLTVYKILFFLAFTQCYI